MEETTVNETQLPEEQNSGKSTEQESPPRTQESPPVSVQGAQFQHLEPDPTDIEKAKDNKLDLLMDISLPVSIELGRTHMLIRDILDLRRGQVVEFEKLASEPVDVLVNGKKMAEGEVVVIEKHFGIRITHMVEASERIRGLGK
jgi:flagellar motor switch protein FliN